jgi:hypothetical protein
MESHSSEAERHGFDVIWWTDHARLFRDYEDIKLDFEGARVSSDGKLVVLGRGMRRSLTRINLERPGAGSEFDVSGGVLRLRLEPPGSGESATVRMSLGSQRGKVHTVDFCRPVTSGLVFEVWGEVEGLGDRTHLGFEFDFSLHPPGRHHAYFAASPGVAGPPRARGDTTVYHEVQVPNGRFAVSLDLLEALEQLPRGDDNTLSEATIVVGARAGELMYVAIDSVRIRSIEASGENQYRRVEQLARAYESQYGVRQLVGVEIGLVHTARLPHMNAYFPESTQAYPSIALDENMRRDAWIDAVHDLGGLVSLNHPFGASLRPRRSEGGAYYGEELSIRELAKSKSRVSEQDFRWIADPVLDGSLKPDILEVGYLYRGSGSLEDHLRLWDVVLANGVRLVGNGASDTHGGLWGPDMVPNPFASWIWARSDSQDELLKALKAGHVAFGDPFFWQSDFAFGIEDAMMGDTLAVEEGRDVNGWVRMDPWRSDVDLRLVQIALGEGWEPEVIRREVIGLERDGFAIRFDRPCFVRVEVYERDGTPLVFSNPVFLIPS